MPFCWQGAREPEFLASSQMALTHVLCGPHIGKTSLQRKGVFYIEHGNKEGSLESIKVSGLQVLGFFLKLCSSTHCHLFSELPEPWFSKIGKMIYGSSLWQARSSVFIESMRSHAASLALPPYSLTEKCSEYIWDQRRLKNSKKPWNPMEKQ